MKIYEKLHTQEELMDERFKRFSRVIGQYTAAILTATLLLHSAAAMADNVDLPRFPAVSPDGSQVTFSWRGDLWKVDADGGHAIRLSTHPAAEHRSAWSPDGSQIAFESDRDGYQNIYVMNADGTDIQRVTNMDVNLKLAGFGTDTDGKPVITLDANIEGDVYRSNRPYQATLDGGPLQRIHDAYGSDPVVSPDGERVAFVRGGYYYGLNRRHSRGPETMDIWTWDRGSGDFTQLTEWPGNDALPQWAGNDAIIYMSDRGDRAMNLHRMSAADGDATATALTEYDERDITDFDVSHDGSTAVFTRWDSLYTLDLTADNPQPKRISITATEDDRDNYELKSTDREVSEAALSPDGQVMAMVAYGEVYVRNVEDGSPTRRVTDSHARERYIAWSPDGLKLYFTSDRDGTESIYAASVALTRSEVKQQFQEITGVKADILAEEIRAKQKEQAAAEPDADSGEQSGPAGTWTGSVTLEEAGEVEFTLELEVDDDNQVSGTLTAQDEAMPVSGTWNPDTDTLNITIETTMFGSVQATLTVSGNSLSGTADVQGNSVPLEATRAGASTTDADGEESEDDEKEEKEVPKEYDPSRWHDAMKFNIEPVVQTEYNDREPHPSPDGKHLAFYRTRGDIVILDFETGEESTLLESWDFFAEFQWSPDGSMIAYAVNDLDFNSEIFIAPVDGSHPPVNITQHPDNDQNPRWSADGRILSFTSERVNEEYDVWRVYLDPDLEALTPEELKAYYEQAAKAAKQRKPLEIEIPDDQQTDNDDDDDADGDSDEPDDEDKAEDIPFDWDDLKDAYLRVERVTSYNGNETSLVMTPGGDRYIFNGAFGESGLLSIKWDGSDRKRLTGRVNVQHMSLTGDKVVFVSGGRAATVSPTGGSVEYINISDEIRIDLQEQASQKFLEAARTLGDRFYHPDMKGIDWDGLTEQYHELARQSRTPDEFNEVANRFLGELTASHLGVRSTGGYQSENRQPHGRLGAEYTRVELDNGNFGFRVERVIPDSPADKGAMALKVDDVITAIELAPFDEDDTVHSRLQGRINEETIVTVQREVEDDGATELHLLITPTSFWSIRNLEYLAWRRDNARKVEEWTDGRLGYIHVQGMNQPSLDVFERDLFAAATGKDGLIVDVRNNGGGWTTDRLLSSIMVIPHAYTIPRGADSTLTGHYPQDRLFIARYSLPMNALCNEKSFSNAEIFSHAFKSLNRGTLVGQETWGGVISTGGFSLIDGTTVRLPFRGWYLYDGTDMENNGAVPDILVPQIPSDEAQGVDAQLRAAVEDLLERLEEGAERAAWKPASPEAAAGGQARESAPARPRQQQQQQQTEPVTIGRHDGLAVYPARFSNDDGDMQRIPMPGGRVIYVAKKPLLTTNDFQRAEMTTDQQGNPQVLLELNDTAAERMRDFSAGHIDKPLVIVFDGRVISAPVLKSQVGSKLAITGTEATLPRKLQRQILRAINRGRRP